MGIMPLRHGRPPRAHRLAAPFTLACALLAAALTACVPPVTDLIDFLDDTTGSDPGPPRYEPQAFVNWESPHVSPLDLSPDRALLFAVNTPDNRLEIFDLTGGSPTPLASVPVGLDPVTVRARTDNEVWVVNHVSDSVSIVDVAARNVVKTLSPGDEPTDVAFAAGRAFVVCSQLNEVVVYDLADLDAPPGVVPIAGEDPRAIAVSPDGLRLYVAVFESGTDTTIIDVNAVSDPNGPYGGQNPIPRIGDPLSDFLDDAPRPPPGPLILKKDFTTNAWLDENGRDWSAFVPWDLNHHDLAVIDAATLAVSYVDSLMNLNMQLAVRPDGRVTVVGTDAANLVRFEPNLRGRFVHSVIAFVDPDQPDAKQVLDLNPHLADEYDLGIPTVDPAERADSLADPRAIAWSADGLTGYVTGMGSNNVAVIDAAGNRLDRIDVGAGPTGLRLDEARHRLYVHNKFDASLSVIDVQSLSVLSRVQMFDPTPDAIHRGRPFLYDARLTSGLGVTACGACHVDGRMDQIAWDLGDPAGAVKPFNQVCDDPLPGLTGARCEDFHPVKGPMATQTLQGIIGHEPLHWRGDRDDLAEFNQAFVGLNGNDRMLSDAEMADFQAFVATLQFPPNPNRTLDNGLRTDLAGGDPQRGRDIFINRPIDGVEILGVINTGFISCNRCHQLPVGTNHRIIPGPLLDSPQALKVPHLRNVHEKTGFDKTRLDNNRGFGFTRTGEFGTLDEFLHFDRFRFGSGPESERLRRDVIAFVMSLGVDTHAGVGTQVTLDGTNNDAPAVLALLDTMLALADAGDTGLVVRGRYHNEPRGFAYLGAGLFQSDRAAEQLPSETLRTAAAPANELTWTLVPLGAQTRIALDADQDGLLDRDE